MSLPDTTQQRTLDVRIDIVYVIVVFVDSLNDLGLFALDLPFVVINLTTHVLL